jgi:hypothetical protein
VALLNGGGGDTHLSDQDQQVGVCYANYRNMKNIIRARIAWTNGQLRVWLDLTNTGRWQLCIETVNLLDIAKSDPRYRLPEAAYFGITGTTRSRADTHVVYSLSIADLSAPKGGAAASSTVKPSVKSTLKRTVQATAFDDSHYNYDDLIVHTGGEDASHPDHVKLGGEPSQPAEPAAPGETMAEAPNQAAHAAAVPPGSSQDECAALS